MLSVCPSAVCAEANCLYSLFVEALTEEEKEKLGKIKKKMKRKVCVKIITSAQQYSNNIILVIILSVMKIDHFILTLLGVLTDSC